MRFSRLKLNDWRQFSSVNIQFHPSVTILTGANGSGKSTLLRVLSQHFGFHNLLLATPTISKKTGILTYLSGLFRRAKEETEHPTPAFGTLFYDDGAEATLRVPAAPGIQYNVQIDGMMGVEGLFVASHRPTSGYQQVSNIPTNALSAQQAYQSYQQEIQNKYNNQHSQFSPTYRIKEAIISMAVFGPGNQDIPYNRSIQDTYYAFKDTLKKILPREIGFLDISVRVPDVVLVTKTGEFVLDAASGGLMALIDLAWQIFLFSRERKDFVAIVDEPENHLHPSMQRTVLNSLVAAFPQAQFIIATHSPFVVSSVKNSGVYVLRFDEARMVNGKHTQTVHSFRLDNVNKAGPAAEILRTVLGVPVTLPLWAADELQRIVSDFELETLDRDRISELRRRLGEAGLGEFYPEALSTMAGPHDQAG